MSDEHELNPAAGENVGSEEPAAGDPMWNIEEDVFFDMDPVQREQILATRTHLLRQAMLDLANGATVEQIRDLLK